VTKKTIIYIISNLVQTRLAAKSYHGVGSTGQTMIAQIAIG
jgi:hypothetical protein